MHGRGSEIARRHHAALARGDKVGLEFVHTAVDDHSRQAYSEVLPDEQATTAAASWTRAQTLFAHHSIAVERVLTDTGASALPIWLHTYNHHRAHTVLGGRPPISRAPVHDLSRHYS